MEEDNLVLCWNFSSWLLHFPCTAESITRSWPH